MTLWELISEVPHACCPGHVEYYECPRCRLEQWAREKAKEWSVVTPAMAAFAHAQLGVPNAD